MILAKLPLKFQDHRNPERNRYLDLLKEEYHHGSSDWDYCLNIEQTVVVRPSSVAMLCALGKKHYV